MSRIVCEFKYLIRPKLSSLRDTVWYETLDKDGAQICAYKDICFRDLSYRAIPQEVKTIVITHPLENIPYSTDTITAWIKEINNLGFLCDFAVANDAARFAIRLEHYQSKNHLIYTLQLIRVLFEVGLCYVPELYFCLIESCPNIDRFDALQTAHKKIEKLSPYVGANPNHAITSLYSGEPNIAKSQFLERIVKTIRVHDNIRSNYSSLWRL